MARKIKRFFVFMFFSLFFTMLGRKSDIPSPSNEKGTISSVKDKLPTSIGINSAEAGWSCY